MLYCSKESFRGRGSRWAFGGGLGRTPVVYLSVYNIQLLFIPPVLSCLSKNKHLYSPLMKSNVGALGASLRNNTRPHCGQVFACSSLDAIQVVEQLEPKMWPQASGPDRRVDVWLAE
jgi:hypothetical protein